MCSSAYALAIDSTTEVSRELEQALRLYADAVNAQSRQNIVAENIEYVFDELLSAGEITVARR